MEKYIIVLILIAMMFFVFCTFPIFAQQPSNAYILTRSSFLADALIPASEKWQTNSYFVYKVLPENAIKIIPESKVIYEYYSENPNNILLSTPYMKVQKSGNFTVCGVPYIID